MLCFFTFWALFLKMFIFEAPKFYLTKYQISNQLFSEVVCICKIHLLMGYFHVKSYKISESFHPYLIDVFEIFTSGIGIIEILKPWRYYHKTPSISEFMVFLKNGKLVSLGWHFKYYFFFDNFCLKQSLVFKIHRGMCFDSRNSKMTSKLP